MNAALGNGERAAGGGAAGSAKAVIAEIRQLRLAPAGEDFDRRLVEAVRLLCRARSASLVRLGPSPVEIALAGESDDLLAAESADEWRSLVERAEALGFAAAPHRSAGGAMRWWTAIPMSRRPGVMLVLRLADSERAQLNEMQIRAQLVADLPDPAAAGSEPVAGALALPAPANDAAMVLDDAFDAMLRELSGEERFVPAVMSLVNGLAALLDAQQAALGWRSGSRMELVATSHRDRFDRHSHPVVLLEDAFDEALDRDQPVWLPAGSGPLAEIDPSPAHALLQQSLGRVHLLSLVLARPQAAPSAVLTLVFDAAREPAPGLRSRLAGRLALALPWLETLAGRDAPWHRRARSALRGWLSFALGPRRPWLKASLLAASLFLVYSLIADWSYEIGGNGQLVTDSTRVLAAQFDAQVDSAKAETGQPVREGELLATLDVRDLRQQLIDAVAERQRFQAEADKARASGALADLEVANARAEQAEVRRRRTAELIAEASIRSPFDGVVVEGDAKDLQGAPMRRGERMYRIARVEGLYAQIQVPERDAALVRSGAEGELALLSRPDERIPFVVESVVPIAQVKGQEGSQFLVRARLNGPAAAWWRPGMTGSAHIDAGRRRVAWILSHRLIDQFHLLLWW